MAAPAGLAVNFSLVKVKGRFVMMSDAEWGKGAPTKDHSWVPAASGMIDHNRCPKCQNYFMRAEEANYMFKIKRGQIFEFLDVRNIDIHRCPGCLHWEFDKDPGFIINAALAQVGIT